ncbi:hypothetical protein [Clostridium beijerinckii]|uniref:hypothetical protein n=1 Tax=Clostridium beijerinckii TaxID=1520 RepID=UPI001361AA4E|nr:hypothetical protein [Clostridium beijerinckii]MZK51866.1 hypothetical protein [Clostridium beijerinckii]MZK61865.1 hypothetical protein [Clostridium beijerinckii]MZK70295.1 hypothetical protein [Clostridium beijerinckii]MZK77428.1 hypothetical protein [Clostridium beijerinckii]MZK85206.1 hypothetical protein [Clostridium beijerinckii]
MNEQNNNLNTTNTNEDKKNTMIGCCTVIIILIAIVAIVYGVHKHIVNVNQQKAALAQEKQEKEAAEKKEKEQAEAKKIQEAIPKINFTGKINPQIVQSGGKVVISVEIENTSVDTTIKGIKLLFSNKNILDKGLVITNIMNGGVRDDRKINWNIEIPPKEKRTFNIVATANEPGEYETAITFGEYNGSVYYKSPDGNEELDGKLVVTP